MNSSVSSCTCYKCMLQQVFAALRVQFVQDCIDEIVRFLPRYNVYGILESDGCSDINQQPEFEIVDIVTVDHVHNIPYFQYTKSYSNSKQYGRLNNFSDILDDHQQIYPKEDCLLIQTENNEIVVVRYHDNVLLTIDAIHCWKLPLSNSGGDRLLISSGNREATTLVIDKNRQKLSHLELNMRSLSRCFSALTENSWQANNDIFPLQQTKKIVSYTMNDNILTTYLALTHDGFVYQRTYMDLLGLKVYSRDAQRMTNLPTIIDIACMNLSRSSDQKYVFLVDSAKKLWIQNEANTNPQFVPYEPFQSLCVRDIQCGDDYALVLMESGECFAFGSMEDIVFYSSGLSKHSLLQDFEPTIGRHTRIRSIACGPTHCVLLTEENEVYGLGNNWNNQLSFDDVCAFYMEPVKLSLSHFGVDAERDEIVRILATKWHTFVITKPVCTASGR